jgi:hypothetical protein
MRRSVAQAFACEGSSIIVYREMSIYFRNVRSSDQCAPSRVLRLRGTPRVVSERQKRFARTTASSIHPQLMQRVAVYRGSDSMPKSSIVSQTSSPRQRWQTICPPSSPKVAPIKPQARSFPHLSLDAQRLKRPARFSACSSSCARIRSKTCRVIGSSAPT